MFVIYKTNHVKKSDPSFIGTYASLIDAREDMQYHARRTFAKTLLKAEQLQEKFGANVQVSLDVDDVTILDASVLKPANETDNTVVDEKQTAEEAADMEGSVEVAESTNSDENVDLGDSIEVNEEGSEEEEEEDKEEEKVDLASQLICNHAMIYRDADFMSVDIIKLTEKRERKYFFFTTIVHVPEPIVSFVIAEVPAEQSYEYDEADDADESSIEEEEEEQRVSKKNKNKKVPKSVRETFEENRDELLTSLLEYEA